MTHRSNNSNFYYLDPIVLSNLDHQENNKNHAKHSSFLPNIKLSKKTKYTSIDKNQKIRKRYPYTFSNVFAPKTCVFPKPV